MMFCFLLSGIAEAATYVRTRSGAGLNVRSHSGRVIGSLPNGAKIRLDPSRPATGKYLYIIYNGKKARVARSLTTSRGSDVAATGTKNKKRQLQVAQSDYSPSPSSGPTPNGTCGSVKVDCSTHRISFTGSVRVSARELVIDCGRGGTTKSGTGWVGGRHSGPRVKDGVRIEGIQGMGDSGGGRVFHTTFWDKTGNTLPTGVNSSAGCIRLSPKVFKFMKKCKGSPLSIIGSGGRGGTKKKRQKTNATR